MAPSAHNFLVDSPIGLGRFGQEFVVWTRRTPMLLPVHRVVAVFVVLLSFHHHPADCISSLLPIVGEERPVINRDRPGCYMDGIHYKFGDRWSPYFEPQGVMVCVKCECLPTEKKGIVQARGETMCRNIKDICPTPTCDHPVLKPGRCCKVCESQDDFERQFTFRPQGMTNDIYSLDEAEVHQPNEFRAVLTGRGVLSGEVRTRAAAIVLLRVSRGKIQFSVRYARLDRPKYLRVLDLNGNVLFERAIQKGITGDRKVCGEWQKVPAVYVSYLREEKLQAVITSSRHPDGVVAGPVVPTSGPVTETFGAILVPPKPDGNGGVVSIDYSPRTRIASYVISLGGVLDSKRKRQFSISIVRGSHVIYHARGSALPKTSKLSGSWRLAKKRERKQLARGRLRMRITFSDGSSLMGDIQPRLFCGVFQAVLSSREAEGRELTSSAGSAVLQIRDDGRLDYMIRVSTLTGDVTRIRLETASSRRSHQAKVVGNLQRSLTLDGPGSRDGWSNGTYKRLEAEDMFRLVNNQMYVSIATARHEISELRGRLVAMDYRNHFDTQVSPITLVPSSDKARGGAGQAWISLGPGCVLHYDAVLAGTGKKAGPYGVFLGSYGNQDSQLVVLRPSVSKQGDVLYNYRYASGEAVDIPEEVFRDLDRGQAFIQVNAKKKGKAVYIGNVTLPNKCWRSSHRMDGPDWAQDSQTEVSTAGDVTSCNFEGEIYLQGKAWLPDVNTSCVTCSCSKGKSLCHHMVCPKLFCESPIYREGECCPSCPHEETTELCSLDNDPRLYRVHSVWHPYLPMMGFSKCAVCTCLPGGRVECDRLPCPTPPCPKAQWIRSSIDSCCFDCGAPPTPEEPDDEPQQDIYMEGACNFMGQFKANGERWHPSIQPFGYMKCFYCDCKDGEFSCGKMQCPKLTCEIKVKRDKICCEECAPNQPILPKMITEEEKKEKEEKKKGCEFLGNTYREGQRWRPNSSPTGSGECAVCTCQEGDVQCRLRCPRVCKEDMSKDKCCRHCTKRNQENKKSKGKRKSSKRKNKKTKRNNKRIQEE